jgi:hypothetical protein
MLECFLPVEAFLLKYDDWPTVTQHGHARVVALADNRP